MNKLKRMISAIMVLALMVTCMVVAPAQAKAATPIYASPELLVTFSRDTLVICTSTVLKKKNLNTDAKFTVLGPGGSVLYTNKVSMHLLFKYPNLSSSNFATDVTIFSAAGTQYASYYEGKATAYFDYVPAGRLLSSAMESTVTVRYYVEP